MQLILIYCLFQYGSEDGDRYRGRDDRDSRYTDEKAGDKWVCNVPSRTIILRQLHVDITEKIVRR